MELMSYTVLWLEGSERVSRNDSEGSVVGGSAPTFVVPQDRGLIPQKETKVL